MDLGKNVVEAVASQNLPLGVESGLGVVIIAVYLDQSDSCVGNCKGLSEFAVAGFASQRRNKKATATQPDLSPIFID